MNSLQNRSTLLDKQYDTGQFSACIVTNIGKEMIAKSQNGQTLTFTRVALGDGLIDDDDDILSFTKVKNERLSANIAKWVDKQNGQFQIQFRVSNQEVEIGFWQREIGIMAKIDGGEEQLYAYATSGNGADFLYDKTTPIDERIVNIDFVIGNAENVQVIVNGSIIYVTIEDLENAIDEHNADENAHDNLIKRLFGSAEATLDSIKLKIKEWAKEVCLPLSGGTMKGNINASGYNITATKFIGNLQGNADSADKLGTSTVGSATKPVYINNGVASAVSVDLSTLAPKESPAFTGIPTAPTPDISDDSDKIVTTAFARELVNSAIDIVRGKLEPTLTPLIDWDAMASANGDTDVRNINNTTYGVTAYGGNSDALNRGDIIFKQAFNMFDAIIIEHTNDTGERHDFTLIPMWLLNKKINTKGCFDLLDTNDQQWITRGNLCPTRPSTTTRFNVWDQNCGIIEIYGVTYKTI